MIVVLVSLAIITESVFDCLAIIVGLCGGNAISYSLGLNITACLFTAFIAAIFAWIGSFGIRKKASMRWTDQFALMNAVLFPPVLFGAVLWMDVVAQAWVILVSIGLVLFQCISIWGACYKVIENSWYLSLVHIPGCIAGIVAGFYCSSVLGSIP
ncbi:MAG: hypothetical protein U0905_20260 [Pirellulales bacterium]